MTLEDWLNWPNKKQGKPSNIGYEKFLKYLFNLLEKFGISPHGKHPSEPPTGSA